MKRLKDLAWIGLGWIGLASILGGLFFIASENLEDRDILKTIHTFESLEKLEQCSSAPQAKTENASRGMQDFERWAKQIKTTQNREEKESAPESKSASRRFAKVDGPNCDLRAPGEPLLDYRLRRFRTRWEALVRSLTDTDKAETGPTLKQLVAQASSRVQGAWIDLRNRVLSKPETHLLWWEYAPRLSFDLGDPDFYGLFLSEPKIEPLFLPQVVRTLFEASIPGTPRVREARPRIIAGTPSQACLQLSSQPEATPQSRDLHSFLLQWFESCREKEKIGVSRCDLEDVRRSISLACVVIAPHDQPLRREVQKIRWSGLPEELDLRLSILHVPENYLEAAPELKTARSLRLVYETARLLDPKFSYRAPDREISGSEVEMENRIELLTRPEFSLARLTALESFSPFLANELPLEVQPYFRFADLRGRTEDLIRQFRIDYTAHRRLL